MPTQPPPPLNGFKLAITMAFIFSLIVLLLTKSDSSKVAIGSKPPACVNKCMKCRPCIASVVVPNHKRKGSKVSSNGEDDSYYLLSWNCRCGDKVFHP